MTKNRISGILLLLGMPFVCLGMIVAWMRHSTHFGWFIVDEIMNPEKYKPRE